MTLERDAGKDDMKVHKETDTIHRKYFACGGALKMAALLIVLTAYVSRPALARQDFIKPGEIAPDFKIADQYDKELSLSSLTGRIVVLFYTGKDKSQNAADFGRRLNARFNESADPGAKDKKIEIIAAGYLKGVPGFLKKTVKGYIKEKKLDGKPDPTPLLLDWKGFIADKYGYNKSEVNVYIIGSDRKILFAGTVVEKKDEDKVAEIIARLIEEKK